MASDEKDMQKNSFTMSEDSLAGVAFPLATNFSGWLYVSPSHWRQSFELKIFHS